MHPVKPDPMITAQIAQREPQATGADNSQPTLFRKVFMRFHRTMQQAFRQPDSDIVTQASCIHSAE